MSDQKGPTKRQFIMGQPAFPRPVSSFVEPPSMLGGKPVMHLSPAQGGIGLYMHIVCSTLEGAAWSGRQIEDEDIKPLIDNAFKIADGVIDRILQMSDFSNKDNLQ